MRLQCLSCYVFALTLSRRRMPQGQRHPKLRAFARATTLGNDLAKMFLNDAEADRKAESRALPSAAAREERLKQVLHHVIRHAATIVSDDQPRFRSFDRHRDRDCSTR